MFIVTVAANLVVWSRCEAQTKKLPYIESGSRSFGGSDGGILIAQPAPNVLAGYSVITGKWRTYKAPAGVRLIPVVGGMGAGVHSTPPQKEVVAFSGVTGKWVTHPIEGDKKMIRQLLAEGFFFSERRNASTLSASNWACGPRWKPQTMGLFTVRWWWSPRTTPFRYSARRREPGQL